MCVCVLRQIADSNQTVYVYTCVCVCGRGHRSNMLLWDSEEASWYFPAAVSLPSFSLESPAVFLHPPVKLNLCGLGLWDLQAPPLWGTFMRFFQQH